MIPMYSLTTTSDKNNSELKVVKENNLGDNFKPKGSQILRIGYRNHDRRFSHGHLLSKERIWF